MLRRFWIHGVGLAVLLGLPGTAQSGDGDPIAIRNRGNGRVSVETFSGLSVVITGDPRATADSSDLPNVDRTLTWDVRYDHTLVRQANVAEPRWIPPTNQPQTDPSKQADPNDSGSDSGPAEPIGEITVQTVPALPSQQPSEPDSQWVKLTTDNVSLWIVRASTLDSTTRLPSISSADNSVSVLVVSANKPSPGKGPSWHSGLNRLMDHLKPTRVIWAGGEPLSDQQADRIDQQLGTKYVRIPHNTVAVSSQTGGEPSRLVLLGTEPWAVPADLEQHYAAMERSCADSQRVFARLSANQLNFKPANGTHTPRWNCEHMSGRQLLFFSQIFHAVDPSIPVMNFNPKQMPPDYRAAHPTWDGQEEARQMERVSKFCRRFIYLLDGMELDRRAPASRWPSLSALLKQMDRHYDQHTANTVKKFELPDWPQE